MHHEIEIPARHPDFRIPAVVPMTNSKRSTVSGVASGMRETGKEARDKSGAGLARCSDKDLSGPEDQLARCTDEVFSLLRYSNFIPHEFVERWSRMIRAIDITRPEHGLAMLDEMIGDYRAVFHACRLAAIESAQRNLERPAFERELAHLKSGLDRLGRLLVTVEAHGPVSA